MKYKVGPASRNGISIGDGLFAKEPIEEDEEVIGMKVGKIERFSEPQWERHHVAKGLPHDAAILVEHIGNKRITDWSNRRYTPRWYKLNHSKNPNLKMMYRKRRIVWVATRDIAVGEELTFFYLEGTEGWE